MVRTEADTQLADRRRCDLSGHLISQPVLHREPFFLMQRARLGEAFAAREEGTGEICPLAPTDLGLPY